MNLPWELHAATLSQLLPVIAGALWRSRLTTPRRLIVVWCLLQLAGDLAQLYLRNAGPNVWLRVITTPLSDALLLFALALWQERAYLRIALKVTAIVYFPTWLALVFYEGLLALSKYSGPFRSLVMLAWSLITLISASLQHPERIAKRDLFWILIGLSLYFALNVAIEPFSAYVLDNRLDLVQRAYLMKARADILAFALIAVGMTSLAEHRPTADARSA